MALIKLGAFVTEISGKIGGTIFSRSKGGAYAKNRVVPLNPNTLKQQLIRSIFAGISQSWRLLTDAERKAWDSAVDDYPYQNRLGETKQLSGKGLHQKLNMNLETINRTVIDSPLSPSYVNSIISMSIVMTNGGVKTIDATKLSVDTGTSWSIEATESVSVGVKNTSNRYRRIGVLTDADTGLPFDIDAKYTSVFGEPLAGGRVNIRLKPVNRTTGQGGAYSTGTTIVV